MNKKTMLFSMLAISLATSGFAQQQTDSLEIEQLDEVVITDSKFKLKRENSGKVITKITRKDLQNLQGKSIAEIINATAGIEINGTKSNAGQNLSYFIRGGRNRQVLVLIDGIAVTDASQIANDYDLRLLNADQVESIEILKGASSSLYGSGASTAVINIKLKEASRDAFAVNLRSTIGTNQSQEDSNYAVENFVNSVSVNGTLDDFSYLASFGHQFTDGLSAIAVGDESDPFNTYNGYVKLGYQFSEAFKVQTYASFDSFKADFDDGFGFADADNLSVTDQYRIGISPEFKYNNGSITLNVAYNNVEREVESSFPTQFSAESFIGDLYNRYNFSDKFYTVLGVNAQQNEIESFSIPFGSTAFAQDIDPEDATHTIIDPYANVVFVSDFGLNVNAGLRLNNHSEYGSHLVYSLNPSFKKELNFGYIKGLASYSTSYIAPSLYQLFEPSFGNSDLEPEENTTIEVGAEVDIKDKATVSVVYFNRSEENFVDFVDQGNFMFQYTNTDNDFTASGVEVVADVALTRTLKLRANGTYTKVDEDLNLRIPELKINAALNYQLNTQTFMSLSYQFNDDRDDAFFSSTTFQSESVNLESYSLIDFYVSHKLVKDKLTVFANMNNVLNEAYEELFGYSTRGRNINIGFTLSL
ncbi:TonB-dependent receptor plug domain-containing protein [Psychroserpens luteolus]|uniref:TonB-dependent receptor plug domain-containing protein n=1 Tax=Psychroserpens luteolus TaxID=2855840 RepID=UPI001E5AA706|nr:TonB-dependent receptor plug domain-containing protein [Psychroserpens luteolus]MCD2259958.1 TonB-dependent receptor [Psychroserpens luteolus]